MDLFNSVFIAKASFIGVIFLITLGVAAYSAFSGCGEDVYEGGFHSG